jgi:hypothetical protein
MNKHVLVPLSQSPTPWANCPSLLTKDLVHSFEVAGSLLSYLYSLVTPKVGLMTD